ncbi:hypothetical protein TNCV_3506771 [Trichonephila clavipes]|uniref:Uncharacterized protein n=1 Tax=Trichonephila clavipes TaxID=2585209 RepID=A0A8X6V316_TRICX|nr:hypothetical protein TNCV_3506771 [Trichonephila clavipes]
MKTAPELPHLSRNYQTIPTEDFNLCQISRVSALIHEEYSIAQRLELMRRRSRAHEHDHDSTSATYIAVVQLKQSSPFHDLNS